jgi:multiple sugar transport system ATP-binding protein
VSAPFLRLRGVAKRFGRGPSAVVALDSLDLDLERGERLVVLGPTGAGKTTLLRVIAGLEPPDAGTITFAGADGAPDVDAASLAPAERDVALVFQNFSLYPHLSVRGNLEFPLRAPGRRLPATEIAERVRWAAALLRIEKLLDRPAKRLSGGEMQRVAIGRALVRRPKLFLLDEPLTNLDAKLRESLRAELAALFRELGTPVIHVTHDQAEALSLGERIVVLSRGRVLQVGAPRSVYLEPATPEVARQLGQPPINLLRATHRGGWWVADDGTPLVEFALAHAAPECHTHEGAHALLGIRPEHVAPDGGASPAVVTVVEDTGPHRVVLLRFAGRPLHLLVPRERAVAVEDVLRPRLDPRRARLWPEEPAHA